MKPNKIVLVNDKLNNTKLICFKSYTNENKYIKANETKALGHKINIQTCLKIIIKKIRINRN